MKRPSNHIHIIAREDQPTVLGEPIARVFVDGVEILGLDRVDVEHPSRSIFSNAGYVTQEARSAFIVRVEFIVHADHYTEKSVVGSIKGLPNPMVTPR